MLCILLIPFFSTDRVLEGASDEFIRVVFCKTDETIQRAALVLRGLGVDNGDDEVTDTGEEVVAACGDAAFVNGSRLRKNKTKMNRLHNYETNFSRVDCGVFMNANFEST